jgi:hypothetical protein
MTMGKPTQIEICENCRYARENGGKLECHKEPPQLACAPIASPAAIQAVGGMGPAAFSWIVNAFWPPVRPTGWCGSFEPHSAMVN